MTCEVFIKELKKLPTLVNELEIEANVKLANQLIKQYRPASRSWLQSNIGRLAKNAFLYFVY
ncbi:hypothetical protein AN618_23820 [Fervidicola ferrireducens]|uniref:Uncharacterized protein n=1 Tax=Fervidicola ferrireducens TaxID=520764 RepID=A0A140L110_9FIRM|nr:hypothetical protein [Fervidicola ferrireducens]KXG74235.1 hypothetical protein AN618_23820 [Fervidicola ferrireducens]